MYCIYKRTLSSELYRPHRSWCSDRAENQVRKISQAAVYIFHRCHNMVNIHKWPELICKVEGFRGLLPDVAPPFEEAELVLRVHFFPKSLSRSRLYRNLNQPARIQEGVTNITAPR